MSLRYSFRHLFYGGQIQKERLYKVLEDLDSANSGETSDITDIKQAIGKATGTGAGGILKDIKDINDGIGDATNPAEGTILYRLAQLEAEDTTPSTPSEQEPSG